PHHAVPLRGIEEQAVLRRLACDGRIPRLTATRAAFDAAPRSARTPPARAAPRAPPPPGRRAAAAGGAGPRPGPRARRRRARSTGPATRAPRPARRRAAREHPVRIHHERDAIVVVRHHFGEACREIGIEAEAVESPDAHPAEAPGVDADQDVEMLILAELARDERAGASRRLPVD